MKIYPPPQGYTADEMRRGVWSLDTDVQSNPDCRKVWSLANVGGIGAPCKKCGSPCQ